MSAQRPHHNEPEGLSLEALQSRSERLGAWISDNPTPILGTLGAVLAVALVVGIIGSTRESAADAAADQLAKAQRDYRVAMGTDAAAIDIPEPANPEAARAARENAVADLQAVIDDHGGSPAAAIAALELGDVLTELDRPEEATTAWEKAAGRADGALRGLLLQRIATAAEARGQLAAAASAYERAAEVDAFPLRFQALAEAARVRAAAGETEAALAILDRLDSDAPDYALPEHVDARLRELRAVATP